MEVTEEEKVKIETHCTRCCSKAIQEEKGCQCDQMRTGIITVYNRGGVGSHWICRKCSEKD